MTINELKKYIFENHKIQYILEQLDCHEIRYNSLKEYYNACQPDGNNPQGVNIRNNEYLNYRSFSRGIDYEDNQDLISLVQAVKKLSFVDSIKFLHKILNLPFEFSKKKEEQPKKIDYLDIFKRQLRSNKRIINVNDIHVLDDKLLNDYAPLLHLSWVQEGITERTRKKFGICYSYRYQRITIPIRWWLNGQLLGCNQRTTVENYEEFNIKKYFITPTYQKHMNIFGLYENYDSIQKAGYVIVGESEKSVFKRDSLGDATVVALQGKSLSDEQLRILIGLNVEIVIALDNDVDVNEVRFLCDKFKNIRKVSYIKDLWGILETKDAPMDANNKDYQFLFDNRIAYDSVEQRKYKESLQVKTK